MYRDNAGKANARNFSSTRDSRLSSIRNASIIKMHYLRLFTKVRRAQRTSGRKAGKQSVSACNCPLFLNYMNDQIALISSESDSSTCCTRFLFFIITQSIFSIVCFEKTRVDVLQNYSYIIHTDCSRSITFQGLIENWIWNKKVPINIVPETLH